LVVNVVLGAEDGRQRPEKRKRIVSHRVRREHREKEVNLSVKN
jgi:hypothetical protein